MCPLSSDHCAIIVLLRNRHSTIPHSAGMCTLMFRFRFIHTQRGGLLLTWVPGGVALTNLPSGHSSQPSSALQGPPGLVIAKLLGVPERQLVKQFQRPLFVPVLAAWLGPSAEGRLGMGRWLPREMRGLWVDWSGHQHDPEPRLWSLSCFLLQSGEDHVHTNVDMFENASVLGLSSMQSWHWKFPWLILKMLVSHCHVNRGKGSFSKMLTSPLWCDLL